jgi:hypothetical protein
MIVSHGGFIMEFYNLVNKTMFNKAPLYSNAAKNCSIHIF